MFYTNEDLALKKEDISPDYIHLSHIIEDLCIDEKIKNYIKGSGSYNQENDFEESLSDAVVDNIFNNNIFKINSNEEKEEDFKYYYHSFTTIENLPLFTKIFVIN